MWPKALAGVSCPASDRHRESAEATLVSPTLCASSSVTEMVGALCGVVQGICRADTVDPSACCVDDRLATSILSIISALRASPRTSLARFELFDVEMERRAPCGASSLGDVGGRAASRSGMGDVSAARTRKRVGRRNGSASVNIGIPGYNTIPLNPSAEGPCLIGNGAPTPRWGCARLVHGSSGVCG
eukprot:scaffold100326_cov31-Tisochrysis_lutea.AAC.1